MKKNDHLDFLYEKMWAAPPNDILEKLDISHNPAIPMELYETVGAPSILPSDKILDMGCGMGVHTMNLAERFSCKVTGIDICKPNLDIAKESCLEKNMENQVSFEEADILDLPYEDGSFNLVWTRDVLIHVFDLQKAFREIRRVLTNNGKAIIFATFETPHLSNIERENLCSDLKILPENIKLDHFIDTFKKEGLKIENQVELHGQWQEYNEEQTQVMSKYLLRTSRMRRNEEQYKKLLGEEIYNIHLSLHLWLLFLMIGKLSSTAFLLSKD